MKTRDRIVDAARELFNEQGYGAVTTATLAAHLGIAEGNLWYHFKTKRALLDAIGEHFSKAIEARLSLQPGTEPVAAYNAPFPDSSYKAGARIFPSFVPLGPNVAVPDQKKAWAVLEAFDKPFLCAFSDGDPITRGGDALFIGRVPGTAGQPHTTLKGGHFI